jgi:hypothetical protein
MGCAGELEEPEIEVAEVSAALTSTAFSDDFESSLSKWTVSGACARNTGAKSVGSYGVRCDKSASITATFSTAGLSNLRFNYTRRTAYYGSGMYLYAEWSSNGSTWTAIEQTQTTSFGTPSFSLPASAANQPALRLRLRANATGIWDRFDVDTVKVTGDSAAGDVCGDAVCGGTESCSTCSADCGTCAPACGDAVCSTGESCGSCSADCGACQTGASDPGVKGPYASCYYTANLSRAQYSGPRMYYPCAPGSASSAPIVGGVFAASTLSPGFTNASSSMFWLGEHLASHGFIVLAMAPDNTWGNNPEWRDAHVDAYNELIEENGRSGSPIFAAVDVNKIQIMGYSKGGGGALMAAQQLSSQGKVVGAVQPLAPYYDSWSAVNLITAPVAIHGGSSDTVASTGSHAVPMFNGLATGTKRLLAIYSGLSHLPWVDSSGTHHPRIKQYVTSWMKVYLSGDANYQKYVNGTNHNASWFSSFNYTP